MIYATMQGSLMGLMAYIDPRGMMNDDDDQHQLLCLLLFAWILIERNPFFCIFPMGMEKKERKRKKMKKVTFRWDEMIVPTYSFFHHRIMQILGCTNKWACL
jgi:hypothetical protein